MNKKTNNKVNKKRMLIATICAAFVVCASLAVGIGISTKNNNHIVAEAETTTTETTTNVATTEKATTEGVTETASLDKTTEEITTEENVTETTTERETTTETTTERETTTEITTEHTHSYKVVNSKEATCTENGYVEYKCSCGDSYKETTNAYGHNSSRPTCTTDGVCSRCGCVTEKAHGHKWSTKTTTETIEHPEEGHEELWVRLNDGYEMPYDEFMANELIIFDHGGSYCKIEKWIVDKPAWTETITHETTTCDHCGATK